MELVDAVENEDIHRVMRLIDNGIDVDFNDGEALRKSVSKNNLYITLVLLRGNANPNILYEEIDVNGDFTGDSETPLHNAVIQDNPRIVLLLLEDGQADPNIENLQGETPLSTLCRWSGFDKPNILTIANILLKYGADINHLDGEEMTPLTEASRDDEVRVVGDRELMKFLLDNGADPYLGWQNGPHDNIGIYNPYIKEYVDRHQAQQRLALSQFSRLPVNLLEKIGLENTRIDPRVFPQKIQDESEEKRRFRNLTRARGLSNLMQSYRDPTSTLNKDLRYEPRLLEGVSRHLSRIRHDPNVIERTKEEERLSRILDEDQLNFLRDIKKGGKKTKKKKRRRYRFK